MMTETCVYRCFDAEGTLLYIGATTNLRRRINAHRSSTPWWSEVHEVIPQAVEEGTQYDVECFAILDEDPKYNRMGKRGWARWSRT